MISDTRLAALVAAFGTGAVIAGALLAAAPQDITVGSDEMTTVDGRTYPVCAYEDCSDVPGQIGVWRNDGRARLIVGSDTYAITPAGVR